MCRARIAGELAESARASTNGWAFKLGSLAPDDGPAGSHAPRRRHE
jgi:hypothetical protein